MAGMAANSPGARVPFTAQENPNIIPGGFLGPEGMALPTAQQVPGSQRSLGSLEEGKLFNMMVAPSHMHLMGIRQGVAYFFSLSLFCIFAPGAILLIGLGTDTDSVYWIGHLGFCAILVPFYIFIAHLVQLRCLKVGQPIPKIMFFWLTAIPAIFYTIAGGIYMSSARYWVSELSASNCAPEEVLRLQSAYAEAQKMQEQCLHELTVANGNVPVYPAPSLQSCELWEKAQESSHSNWKAYKLSDRIIPGTIWTKDWYYLASMEVEHLCAGFCQGGQVLWSTGTTAANAPACKPYVMQKMAIIQRNAMIACTLGLIIIGLAYAAYLMLSPSLQAIGHM